MKDQATGGSAIGHFITRVWVLMLIPALLLGMILVYGMLTGGVQTEQGQVDEADVQVEQMTIERILLPEPGLIQVEVVNDGAGDVTVPQLLIDDAYWDFTAEPSTTIPPQAKATFTIPYPWVAEELHVVRLITSRGATFDGEIVARGETTSADLSQ
ncbi:MAG: hypothetical protein IT328_17780 [Caldilineaceae bacterium]|nr:hypothetical protein [Caldilineaceae bacterium]